MDDLEDPRRVFGEDIDKSYQKEAVEDIIRYRHEFGDQLFIDRLLKALGINNGEESSNSARVAYANNRYH